MIPFAIFRRLFFAVALFSLFTILLNALRAH